MSDNKAEGRRQDALAKQRLQMRQDFERQKQTLISETEKARPTSNRFVGENDSMEESLKKHTVGLVHLEEFQQRRKELEELKAREAAMTNELKYVTLHLLSVAREEVAYRTWSVRLGRNKRRLRSARKPQNQNYPLLWTMRRMGKVQAQAPQV